MEDFKPKNNHKENFSKEDTKKEDKNPFGLSDEALAELYSDNDNSSMYKK